MCVFALTATCLAGKLRKTDSHSLGADEFQASSAWANDEWGDEDWQSEPANDWEPKPLKGWAPKPIKEEWNEPIVVEKKVPVYVPGSCAFYQYSKRFDFHSLNLL